MGTSGGGRFGRDREEAVDKGLGTLFDAVAAYREPADDVGSVVAGEHRVELRQGFAGRHGERAEQRQDGEKFLQ